MKVHKCTVGNSEYKLKLDSLSILSVGCVPPTPPPRGSLGDLTSSQEGVVVAFQCIPGLVPSQQMISVCAANGNWTPDPAELVCRGPGMAVNIFHSTYTTIAILPLCSIPADCGDPSPPINGFVMAYNSILEGSQIVFQCSPGFVPSQQMMSVCMADGIWTPNPAELLCREPGIVMKQYTAQYNHFILSPYFLPADCGDPSLPMHGFVMVYNNTLENSQIVFQCSPGFVPSWEMMSVCDANGSWTPDPAGLECRGVWLYHVV